MGIHALNIDSIPGRVRVNFYLQRLILQDFCHRAAVGNCGMVLIIFWLPGSAISAFSSSTENLATTVAPSELRV